jgi:O-antigen/teichoic acid export membrane protein
MGLVANAQSRLCTIALGAFAPPAQLASFGAAWKLAQSARRLPHAVFGAALPVLTREYAVGERHGTRVHRRLQASVLAFAAGASGAFIVCPEAILAITYGGPFSGDPATLRWMGIAVLPMVASGHWKTVLYARGAEGAVLRWTALVGGVQAVALPAAATIGASAVAAALALTEWTLAVPLWRVVASTSGGHGRRGLIAARATSE